MSYFTFHKIKLTHFNQQKNVKMLKYFIFKIKYNNNIKIITTLDLCNKYMYCPFTNNFLIYALQ